MERKNNPAYNPYFVYPFLLWVVIGGLLTFSYSQVALFTYINGHYSSLLDSLMFTVTKMGEAKVIITVLVGLLLLPKHRNWWFFSLATGCNVVPMLLQQSLKSLFNKPRPMHYFEHTNWVHILDHWDRVFERSFPSGHSQGAFSFFCFLSLLLLPKYKGWGVVFFILALSVCYSRVYLTAHFFEDVYAGSIIGVVTTTTVYVLMHKYFRKLFPVG